MSDCKCNMFAQKRICWHTGYKYIRPKKPDLPAIKRMKERVRHPNEIKEEHELSSR